MNTEWTDKWTVRIIIIIIIIAISLGRFNVVSKCKSSSLCSQSLYSYTERKHLCSCMFIISLYLFFASWISNVLLLRRHRFIKLQPEHLYSYPAGSTFAGPTFLYWFETEVLFLPHDATKKRGYEIAWLFCRLSVCPSVTVTLRYDFYTGWNTSKIIVRPNSLGYLLSLTPNIGGLV